LDATAAATRAGYSKKSASSLGYQLLQIGPVRKAIMAGKAAQLDKAELTAARVLEELRRIAFADVRGFFDPRGNLRNIATLTGEQASALASFEVIIKNAKAGDGVTDEVHKIRGWDKVHALELLAKHFRLLVERVEIVDPDGRVKRLQAARKRTAT